MNESVSEEEALPRALLKILGDMLHNRITKKKGEMHKTQNIKDMYRRNIDRDTDIAMGIIEESSVRRQLGHWGYHY